MVAALGAGGASASAEQLTAKPQEETAVDESKLKVHMPTRNTRSHTRSVLVSTPWAALWRRSPVRVTFRYMYHFILKIGTFTCTCLLTMESHHTNRLSGPIP